MRKMLDGLHYMIFRECASHKAPRKGSSTCCKNEGRLGLQAVMPLDLVKPNRRAARGPARARALRGASAAPTRAGGVHAVHGLCRHHIRRPPQPRGCLRHLLCGPGLCHARQGHRSTHRGDAKGAAQGDGTASWRLLHRELRRLLRQIRRAGSDLWAAVVKVTCCL